MLAAAPYDENISKNELMVLVEECEDNTWTLFFDGSKCLQGARVGIVLVSPKYVMILMDYKLDFECTNNMVEYETLVLGLKEPTNLGINQLNFVVTHSLSSIK